MLLNAQYHQTGSVYDKEDRKAWREMLMSSLFMVFMRTKKGSISDLYRAIAGNQIEDDAFAYDLNHDLHSRDRVMRDMDYFLFLISRTELGIYQSLLDLDENNKGCEWISKNPYRTFNPWKKAMTSADLRALNAVMLYSAMQERDLDGFHFDYKGGVDLNYIASLVLNYGEPFTHQLDAYLKGKNCFETPSIYGKAVSMVYALHLDDNFRYLTELKPSMLDLDPAIKNRCRYGAIMWDFVRAINENGLLEAPFFKHNFDLFGGMVEGCNYGYSLFKVCAAVKTESRALGFQNRGTGSCVIDADMIRHAYSIVIHSSVFTLEELKGASVEVQEAFGFLALYLVLDPVGVFTVDAYAWYKCLTSPNGLQFTPSRSFEDELTSWRYVNELDYTSLIAGINKAVKVLLSLN